jgi:cobalt-zinc-cadmium efflux system outer membrane protein
MRTCLATAMATTLFNSLAFAQIGPPSAYVDATSGTSLADAIQYAVDHHPSLRSARSEIDVANAMKTQASLRPNPTASFERRIEPGGTDSQTSVSIEWPLDLFRQDARVTAADRETDVARLGAIDRERLVAAEVRMRYGAAAAAVRNLSVVESLVDTARRQLELLRQRVEQGATPPLDRDVMQVEARRLDAERAMAISQADSAMLELRRVMGMASSAPLKLRDTIDGLAIGAAPAPGGSVGSRADVREAEARVIAATAAVERAAAERNLDISLFGGYMRMDAGFPQLGVGSDGELTRVRGLFNYWSAGAMVTVPLRSRNQGEIAAARASITRATAALDSTKLNAESELATARARSGRAGDALQALEQAVRLAKQNVDVVRQTYELGRLSAADVLTEQRRYWDVEREYTQALREVFDAEAAVRAASGELR